MYCKKKKKLICIYGMKRAASKTCMLRKKSFKFEKYLNS